MPDSKIVNRVCGFVEKIHNSRENGTLWSLSTCEKGGEALISFLGELARVGLVPQVDKIFRYGKGHYPLVNQLSTSRSKDKFFEMFHTLPKKYQDKLLSETISYEEGDKIYGCPLIGGTALMGFQSRHKFYNNFGEWAEQGQKKYIIKNIIIFFT